MAVYQLWWAQGYQHFADVESGVTTKVPSGLSPIKSFPPNVHQVKGYSQSALDTPVASGHMKRMYNRVRGGEG